ncbi:MAG: hypothetical protein ACYC3N_00170 [Halothiobacillus sp.]|jgi:hypothetical protein
MAIPDMESYGLAFNRIKKLFGKGFDAASKHYKTLAAINDLNVLLMAPAMLKNKVIVIDDIERKHEKLGIDEVLGFIDEYSNQHGTRFILVLNDDQLSSKGGGKRRFGRLFEKKSSMKKSGYQHLPKTPSLLRLDWFHQIMRNPSSAR